MVLIENVCLVLRGPALDAKYPGGWPAFIQGRGPRLCADDEIASLSFTTAAAAEAFVDELISLGLDSDHVAIVDQHWGLLNTGDWLEVGTARVRSDARVAVCRLVGSTDHRLFSPPGWTYEGSASERGAATLH